MVYGTPGRGRWNMVKQCDKLSGRNMRRLPFLAWAVFTEGCSVAETLDALEKAVTQQLGGSGDEVKIRVEGELEAFLLSDYGGSLGLKTLLGLL
jgi:hypothetical protein